MVEAFLQHKGAKRGIIDLYKVAIEEKFRFFSFGDGMLIK
jgi:S-adenosylmethionine:tRNA-ribosyltransferase-isomerase (queuine synthetase)